MEEQNNQDNQEKLKEMLSREKKRMDKCARKIDLLNRMIEQGEADGITDPDEIITVDAIVMQCPHCGEILNDKFAEWHSFYHKLIMKNAWLGPTAEARKALLMAKMRSLQEAGVKARQEKMRLLREENAKLPPEERKPLNRVTDEDRERRREQMKRLHEIRKAKAQARREDDSDEARMARRAHLDKKMENHVKKIYNENKERLDAETTGVLFNVNTKAIFPFSDDDGFLDTTKKISAFRFFQTARKFTMDDGKEVFGIYKRTTSNGAVLLFALALNYDITNAVQSLEVVGRA